eukprot:1703478-Rhodomonas_salina.2
MHFPKSSVQCVPGTRVHALDFAGQLRLRLPKPALLVRLICLRKQKPMSVPDTAEGLRRTIARKLPGNSGRDALIHRRRQCRLGE